MTHRMRRLVLALAAVAMLFAGCSYDATTIPEPEAAPSTPPPSAAPPVTCNNATESYAPGGTVAQLGGNDQVDAIRDRGRLVAGVSADTFKMASRDPLSGDLVGFDIDMVNAVAQAIFPDKPLDQAITFRVINAAERLPALIDERVDIVVRNMTMNCARWVDIAFSAVYYESGQKLLVRQDLADLADPVDTVAELGGLRVCAPLGTTSLTNIEEQAPDDTEIVTAVNHTQCLVKFQRGEADAITGDDTVLAGLAAQDPYAVVPPGQPKFTAEPYGIGVNKANVGLVRFINAVLEQSRADGSWQDSYDTWLRPTLGQGTQPQPTYGRGPIP
jgi:polar amino acid transport system substrate-binding protein